MDKLRMHENNSAKYSDNIFYRDTLPLQKKSSAVVQWQHFLSRYIASPKEIIGSTLAIYHTITKYLQLFVMNFLQAKKR